MMGRALPEPAELGEGHLGFPQHDRRAWKDSKGWTHWGGTKDISKWRSVALNHEARGDPKETSVCSGEEKAHRSVVTKKQVRQNHSKTSRGNPNKELQVCFGRRDCFCQKNVPNFCLIISFFEW